MTNIVLLSITLFTNWGMVSLSNPSTNGYTWEKSVQSGEVYQLAHIGYMVGTNAVEFGTLMPNKLGMVYKTNDVPSKIFPVETTTN